MGPPRRPLRVVLVDDSALMRRVLADAMAAEGDIRVVAAAADAAAARRAIEATDPDVVTLDVEMPGTSGLDLLKALMATRPRPVVMVSAFTAAGAETALAALEAGAVEVSPKPAGMAVSGVFAARLRAKIRLAAAARPLAPPAPAPAPPVSPWPDRGGLIALAASTGGVTALGRMLAALPADLPPIAVVQHMPAVFTARFAARLARQLGRDVAEARDGARLLPGAVRVAPGGRHLRIATSAEGGFLTRLSDAAPVAGHRPSADVLLRSVAAAAGRRAVGVILTGMGRDGAAGLAALKRAGGACLGQDEASSTVWGMPKAARDLGALDEALPLDDLPGRVCALIRARRGTCAA